MIPKKIHYCWFGGTKKSRLIEMCIESWRKVMPDYDIKEWNEENFDVESAPAFVREAIAERKWAFVADYVRLYALYAEGGIYMDTDVKVNKRFDDFLDNNFFSCQELHPDIFVEGSIDEDGYRNQKFSQVLGIGICSAVMGAQKGCCYIKDCLEYYQKLHFSSQIMNDVVIVNILALMLEKYGYRYLTKGKQKLTDNILIMEPWVFCGVTSMTPDTYALHLYNGSWVEGNDTLKHRIRNRFPHLYGCLQSLLRILRH